MSCSKHPEVASCAACVDERVGELEQALGRVLLVLQEAGVLDDVLLQDDAGLIEKALAESRAHIEPQRQRRKAKADSGS